LLSAPTNIVKRCLVTGGAGFIGSHLVERLLQEGYAVCVLDNFSSGKRENLNACSDNIELIQADIRDLEALIEACTGVDAVFHQAAIASVYHSIMDPHETHQVNVNGTVNVLEAAHRTGVKQVILASSAAVYGADASLPKSEKMSVKPVSPYGLQKLVGEQYGEIYSNLFDLKVTCFRYFNVYGTRQDPRSQYSGVISIFIDTILSGGMPTIYGDGLQSRDFVHVSDICQANILALNNQTDSFGVFNVGCGVSYSLLDLLSCLKKHSGKVFDIQFKQDRRGDLRHSLADISTIQQALGYVPQGNFENGLLGLLAEQTLFSH
jgi:UDP-glucose 4-epimerase